ncbi:hypothetical protein SABR111722_18045 [Saccharibacillus brassicae]
MAALVGVVLHGLRNMRQRRIGGVRNIVRDDARYGITLAQRKSRVCRRIRIAADMAQRIRVGQHVAVLIVRVRMDFIAGLLRLLRIVRIGLGDPYGQLLIRIVDGVDLLFVFARFLARFLNREMIGVQDGRLGNLLGGRHVRRSVRIADRRAFDRGGRLRGIGEIRGVGVIVSDEIFLLGRAFAQFVVAFGYPVVAERPLVAQTLGCLPVFVSRTGSGRISRLSQSHVDDFFRGRSGVGDGIVVRFLLGIAVACRFAVFVYDGRQRPLFVSAADQRFVVNERFARIRHGNGIGFIRKNDLAVQRVDHFADQRVAILVIDGGLRVLYQNHVAVSVFGTGAYLIKK